MNIGMQMKNPNDAEKNVKNMYINRFSLFNLSQTSNFNCDPVNATVNFGGRSFYTLFYAICNIIVFQCRYFENKIIVVDMHENN